MGFEKGNFIIIFLIVLLIAAILYFAVINPIDFGNSKLGINEGKNKGFFEELQDKLPSSKTETTTKEETDLNKHPLYMKILLNNPLDVKDKNVLISGKTSIIIGDRTFLLSNPYLLNFTGTFEKDKISGYVDTVHLDESVLEMKTDFTIENFEEITKISVPSVKMDFENFNNTGTLKIADKTYDLNNTYIKINKYTGKLDLEVKDKTQYLILDGNVSSLKFIDGAVETKVE